MDVINFAQNKATKCLQNENLIDKESASLLWNFIVLLCRQNGVRVSFTFRAALVWASGLKALGPQSGRVSEPSMRGEAEDGQGLHLGRGRFRLPPVLVFQRVRSAHLAPGHVKSGALPHDGRVRPPSETRWGVLA